MVRVFLLDDHEVVGLGVRELLETADDLEVVGEAATADEAIRRVPALRPDVAILDVRLGDGNGIEVCRHTAPDQRLRADRVVSEGGLEPDAAVRACDGLSAPVQVDGGFGVPHSAGCAAQSGPIVSSP